jgi:glyoxylase-like metal-dependent hydrolase (beta-lactamase superfamily II)
MIRERVADNVYVFTSERYAQVNAGAVIGPEWSVVIDTLAYPDEARDIRQFIEGRLERPIKYVINTHYHSDHTMGNAIFTNAIILSHEKCRRFLDTQGREAFQAAQRQNRELRGFELKLPDVVFSEGNISLRVGRRTLELIPLPGHSPDGIGVLVLEDRVLFSGDIMMPVPYLVDGDIDQMVANLKKIPKLKLENLVLGHGDSSILRGEVQKAVRANLSYLSSIKRHVRKAARLKDPEGYLQSIDIEQCGKSRILINGLAVELHRRNLSALYQQLYPDR